MIYLAIPAPFMKMVSKQCGHDHVKFRNHHPCLYRSPTNIGALLKRAPGVVEKVRFVGMHGSVYKGILEQKKFHPEYNVKFHLEDAQASLHAAWPVTITPLDTCGTVRLDGELQAAVASAENQSMQAVIGNYKAWLAAINKDEEIAEVKSSILFDTVAIYLAFAEDLLEVEDLRIRIDDDGYTRIDETGNMMRVATKWRDYDAFLDLLVERLLAAALITIQATVLGRALINLSASFVIGR